MVRPPPARARRGAPLLASRPPPGHPEACTGRLTTLSNVAAESAWPDAQVIEYSADFCATQHGLRASCAGTGPGAWRPPGGPLTSALPPRRAAPPPADVHHHPASRAPPARLRDLRFALAAASP